MSGAIPQEVLGDALGEAIKGRKVRAAVFTTFSFDPGFFELHILPFLFGPSSPIDKVRLLRLEDHLRSADVAVYYDRTALSQDATPARSDFRRIDVRRWTGCFHPKLVLVLVEDPGTEEEADAESEWDEAEGDEGLSAQAPMYSLIVGTLSANLTRAGWWENVETAHFEEIKDRRRRPKPCPFRKDLLSLIGRIHRSTPDADHTALHRIHEFLTARTRRKPVKNVSYKGRWFTRLFCGQESLPDWLAELGLGSGGWNLEVLSPYFDRHEAKALRGIIELLEPEETRVYLPRKRDGSAAVTEEYYRDVDEVAWWSTLPPSIVRFGGGGNSDKVSNRWVHAKVYRLWQRNGPDIVLTGSVNLTEPAHSAGNRGNLEAAFLVDITTSGRRRWWLEHDEYVPHAFAETQNDLLDETEEVFVDITFEYHWGEESLRYRIESNDASGSSGSNAPAPIEISEPGGRPLFRIDAPRTGAWTTCDPDAAGKVAALLPSTSFLRVSTSKGSWRVLVREEGMAHKPSLLHDLTPQEILQYWSLLSPEQKEDFLARKLAAEAQLEGLRASSDRWDYTGETLFSRFAGVFHAFGRLHTHVETAIRKELWSEATTRLFGAKYDSLPVLLEQLQGEENSDSVLTYVTYLSACQVRSRIQRTFPEFWERNQSEARRLESLLEQLPRYRDQLGLGPQEERFLDWYEEMFLREIHRSVETAAKGSGEHVSVASNGPVSARRSVADGKAAE